MTAICSSSQITKQPPYRRLFCYLSCIIFCVYLSSFLNSFLKRSDSRTLYFCIQLPPKIGRGSSFASAVYIVFVGLLSCCEIIFILYTLK